MLSDLGNHVLHSLKDLFILPEWAFTTPSSFLDAAAAAFTAILTSILSDSLLKLCQIKKNDIRSTLQCLCYKS